MFGFRENRVLRRMDEILDHLEHYVPQEFEQLEDSDGFRGKGLRVIYRLKTENVHRDPSYRLKSGTLSPQP